MTDREKQPEHISKIVPRVLKKAKSRADKLRKMSSSDRKKAMLESQK